MRTYIHLGIGFRQFVPCMFTDHNALRFPPAFRGGAKVRRRRRANRGRNSPPAAYTLPRAIASLNPIASQHCSVNVNSKACIHARRGHCRETLDSCSCTNNIVRTRRGSTGQSTTKTHHPTSTDIDTHRMYTRLGNKALTPSPSDMDPVPPADRRCTGNRKHC